MVNWDSAQGLGLTFGRRRADQAFEQDTQQVGHLGQVGPHIRGRVHRELIGQQSERQRVATSERDRSLSAGFVDPRSPDQRTRCFKVEVSERDHAQEPAPARVCSPTRTRWPASGDQDRGVRIQLRQEFPPQPFFELGSSLESVDHQQQLLRSLAAGRFECLLERDRRGVDRAHVHLDDSPAALAGELRRFGKKGTLAYAPGPVEEHDADRRVRRQQFGRNQIELPLPSDESLAAILGKHGCERLGLFLPGTRCPHAMSVVDPDGPIDGFRPSGVSSRLALHTQDRNASLR